MKTFKIQGSELLIWVRIRIKLKIRIRIRQRSFRIQNTALKATSGPATVPTSGSWRLMSAAGEVDRSAEAVTSSDTFNTASEGRVVLRRAWVVGARGRLGTDCSGLDCVADFSELKQTYTYYDYIRLWNKMLITYTWNWKRKVFWLEWPPLRPPEGGCGGRHSEKIIIRLD